MVSDAAASLWLLGAFLLLLLVLAWLSRQISLLIQLPVYHLTRSQDAPTVAIFLVFLPGVLIHELAHWSMARLLGLRTGKFRVWPRRQGRHIGLGSVSVQSKGALADSLVGLAPLVVGVAVVAAVGSFFFGTYNMADRLSSGDYAGALTAFWAALRQPDGALWAYLLFAVANAMMPSAADREPIKPVLLYAALAAIIYVVLRLPAGPFVTLMGKITPALQVLVSAFLFTILLDLAALLVLWVIRLLIAR
jgi:hypothetical protein